MKGTREPGKNTVLYNAGNKENVQGPLFLDSNEMVSGGGVKSMMIWDDEKGGMLLRVRVRVP